MELKFLPYQATTMLIAIYLYREMNSEEYCACIHVLSHAEVLDEKVGPLFFKEAEYYLDEKRTLNFDNLARLKCLLEGMKTFAKTAPSSLTNKVSDLIFDYRFKSDIKGHALLCFAAIAMPSIRTVEIITNYFRNPPIGLDADLVRVPAILARQCRQSIEYVIACVSALAELQRVMVEFHKSLLTKQITEASAYNVTELRQGIDDVTEIIVAFNEFIDSASHPKTSSNPKKT
jgi:hypothetical protein